MSNEIVALDAHVLPLCQGREDGSPPEHQWESLNGVAGWFGCVHCGLVGVCAGCLPEMPQAPASWGVSWRCERHQQPAEDTKDSEGIGLWQKSEGVPTLTVMTAPAGAIPYQRMTAEELARLRAAKQHYGLLSTSQAEQTKQGAQIQLDGPAHTGKAANEC